MQDDGMMSYEEFMAQPVPIRTDDESVAQAVRYLEAWLPVGRAALGSGAEHAIGTLMQFVEERRLIR